ncbi:MAG: hypothetical protein ABR497_08975 [Kiritimatiellia bacterium]
MKNQFAKLLLLALVLASGMVLSAHLISRLFVRVRQEQAITVKGYAENDVVSDVGRFACHCRARGASLQEAYTALQHSRQSAINQLQHAGLRDAEMTLGTINTARIARRDAQGKETNEIEAMAAWAR